MESISVRTGIPYEALVERGLLDRAGELARRAVKGRRVMIAADETVAGLYLGRAEKSFARAGFGAASFVFPPGEGSKRLAVVEKMLMEADRRGLTRTDCFVSLGGGVTGDMTGLAASLYLRGVDYLQIPTTLLAMVDASVGGKTAVNLPSGKNLCGTFYQPRMVLCDPALLNTLPSPILAEGMAEVIKHGAICSPALLDRIQSGAAAGELIADNIRIKSGIVERDERESGERKLLNLGHTFGHALEKLSGYSIYHGEGVAVGILIAAYAAERSGRCERGVFDELKRLLQARGLPVGTPFTAAEIASGAMNDKKRAGDQLTVVLPERRGRSALCRIRAEELEPLIACCDGEVTGLCA